MGLVRHTGYRLIEFRNVGRNASTFLPLFIEAAWALYSLARIMHKFSTAATKSSGVLHRLCCATRKRVPPASSTYRTVRLRGPLSRVAQRTQVVAFVAS